MKATMGEDGRSHFRLDVEKQTIYVDVSIREDECMRGILRDVSDGGISFMLQRTPLRDLTNQHVQVSFMIDERIFRFEMCILRKFLANGRYFYAGEFVETSKIKRSQLSLLLMKMKLITQK